MLYNGLYNELKSAFQKLNSATEIESLDVKICRKTFNSSPVFFEEPFSITTGTNSQTTNKLYHDSYSKTKDDEIRDNLRFDYFMFESPGKSKKPGLIFLFHGLNEKKWEKYLPWAYQLTKLTGKTVILFPIAFHMNRAPSAWSDSRLMQKLATERAGKSTNSHSSFANAAISERLDSSPHRFFLSGWQTYNDFYKLIKSIRAGEITGIPSDTGIDLFGYSIGAFFSLLLMMDNPGNLLGLSKLFIFCGGSTYDKTDPVSKYIVDKSASTSVSMHFDKLLADRRLVEVFLDHYFRKFAIRKSFFPGLMNYEKFKGLREVRMRQIQERIYTVVLKNDFVIVPSQVKVSLCGESSINSLRVEEMDFDFPYSHITPFPVSEKYKQKVDYAFLQTMEKAGDYLIN